MTSRKTEQAFRTAILKHELKTTLPGVLLGVVVVGAVVSLLVWGPKQPGQDVRGAVLQDGYGVVSRVTWPVDNQHHPTPRYDVVLRVGNQQVGTTMHEAVALGQKVRIKYRVGNTGTIYVVAVKRDERAGSGRETKE